MTARLCRGALLVGTLAATWAFGTTPALAAPVDGGGSFDDAPLLRAGSYSDTILPQETLFYAVALGEGQRLRVNADVDLSGGSQGERGDADALGGFGLTLYGPLRERLPAAYVGAPFRGGRELQSDGDTRRGPRVTGAAAADRRKTAGTGEWTGPGIYTFTATISAIHGDTGAVVEFPLRLQITIEGRAVPAARIGHGPLGDPAAAAAVPTGGAARRARPGSPDAQSRVPDAVVLLAGLGALLAGALLAAGAHRMMGRDIGAG